MLELLDARPLIVAIAGPNGAGKTTFYHAFLRQSGLRYVNADDVARAQGLGAYEAASVASALRHALVATNESFIFETVLSDPEGEKIAFLEAAAARGYSTALLFIGISGAATSETRVSMRVSQGGHDVPTEKLEQRFPRTLENLRRAIGSLPLVLVYDNDELHRPFREVARFVEGRRLLSSEPVPAWLEEVLRP